MSLMLAYTRLRQCFARAASSIDLSTAADPATLAQAKIVPESSTLDARSLAAVTMPNRDGFVPDARPEQFARP